MSDSRTVSNSKGSDGKGPVVALVMKLGGGPDVAAVSRLASRLASRLVGDQLTATWAICGTEQLGILRNVNPEGRGLALDITQTGDLSLMNKNLAQLRAVSRVGSLLASESQLRRCVELAGDTNITAALVEDAASKGPRLAASGLWRFAAGLEFPVTSSWPRLFSSRTAKNVDDVATGGVAVVKIDVGQLAGSSAGQKQVDRLLTKLAWAKNDGTGVMTLSEVAAIYAARTEVRPQRSILRAA